MFERILWKDDLPTLVNLTGEQLTAVLSQSKTLRQNHERGEVKDVEKEWLVTSGVVKAAANAKPTDVKVKDVPDDNLCRDDAAKEANDLAKAGVQLNSASQGGAGGVKDSDTCINEMLIDEAQIYKVATSQALAGNDQVFPGISKLPPGRPALDEDFDILRLFGPTITKAVENNWHPAAKSCEQDCSKTSEAPERRGQQRRLFHLSVQNVKISYSAYTPNMSDVNLLNTLGGVTDSRASSPSPKSVVANGQSPRPRRGHLLDWGLLEMLDFNFTQTGNQQGGFPTVSFATNNFLVGAPSLRYIWGTITLVTLGRACPISSSLFPRFFINCSREETFSPSISIIRLETP